MWVRLGVRGHWALGDGEVRTNGSKEDRRVRAEKQAADQGKTEEGPEEGGEEWEWAEVHG